MHHNSSKGDTALSAEKNMYILSNQCEHNFFFFCKIMTKAAAAGELSLSLSPSMLE